MFLITCPYCGPRDETEFHCGGEAHIVRPSNAWELTDDAYADYLFMRTNTKGPHRERWVHSQGCRQWFNVLRDTRTHRILKVYPMGVGPDDPAAQPDDQAGAA